MYNFNYYESCAEFAQKYRTAFKRCNVSTETLYKLSKRAEITCTYTRTEDGQVVEQKTEEVTVQTYANVISSVPFFADRVQKSHTPFGYIATEFTARCPYADVTVCRKFTFKCRK